jgi:competence protein ComEA
VAGRLALLLCLIPIALTAQKAKLPEGPGKAVVEKVCGDCHGVEMATTKRETKEGWNAIVDDMIQRGAQGTDAEFDQVVDYLARNFPKAAAKVNVNEAPATDLAAALDISEKQAAAIVRYREEKGKFRSIEDLAKVPGLDAAKIEANKSKLIF